MKSSSQLFVVALLVLACATPLAAQADTFAASGGSAAGTLPDGGWTPGAASPLFLDSSDPGDGAVWSDRKRRRWRRRHQEWSANAYVVLKGGGLHLSERSSNDGVFLGAEVGTSVEDVLEVGFGLDYFRRGASEMVVLQESHANDLPISVVATLSESAAHLIPMGVNFRLKIPVGNGKISPFISANLAYEVLFLRNDGTLDDSDPLQALLTEEETFAGFGWQTAAGVHVGLSSSFGLFGELGIHRSSPQQDIEFSDGTSAKLKVDLDGAFLRAGLRIAM